MNNSSLLKSLFAGFNFDDILVYIHLCIYNNLLCFFVNERLPLQTY